MSSSDSHQLKFSPESSISTVPEEYVEHLEKASTALLLVWAQGNQKNTIMFDTMNFCSVTNFSLGTDSAGYDVEYEITLQVKSVHKAGTEDL